MHEGRQARIAEKLQRQGERVESAHSRLDQASDVMIELMERVRRLEEELGYHDPPSGPVPMGQECDRPMEDYDPQVALVKQKVPRPF
jgi:hypothetical protein